MAEGMTPEQREAVIAGALQELINEKVRAAVAEEREACAKEADARTFGANVGNPVDAAAWIAHRIRARGPRNDSASAFVSVRLECKMFDFVECASCRAKSGSPMLCDGCVRNRETISRLRERMERAELGLQVYMDIVPHLTLVTARLVEQRLKSSQVLPSS